LQSSLFQSALLFGVYFLAFLAALPAGWLNWKRVGLQKGNFCFGFLTCAGCALSVYSCGFDRVLLVLSLFAFVCDVGLRQGNTGIAPPTIISPFRSRRNRLSGAGTCTVLQPLSELFLNSIIGGPFILFGIDIPAGQIAAMNAGKTILAVFGVRSLPRSRGTYLAITALLHFLVSAVLLPSFHTPLPEIRERAEMAVTGRENPPRKHWEVLAIPNICLRLSNRPSFFLCRVTTGSESPAFLYSVFYSTSIAWYVRNISRQFL